MLPPLGNKSHHTKMKRIVIIGGVAGGATAAARIARLDRETTCVTILERGHDVSFANCGLPYHIGGTIVEREKLVLFQPDALQKTIGITCVRTLMEVTRIECNCVHAVNRTSGQEEVFLFDTLIYSPGATPIVPNVPGLPNPNKVFTLRTLQDMDRIITAMKQIAKEKENSVAVIGAGFIGLEMAEQLRLRNLNVTVVERSSTVLPQADAEMSAFLHTSLRENGVRLILSDSLSAVEQAAGSSRTRLQLESGCFLDVDFAILCVGIRPESQLAKESGIIEVSKNGRIPVNQFMQTNVAHIYAVGDVVETQDPMFPQFRSWVALGNVANMQARVAADHAIRGDRVTPFHGSYGTSIVKVFGTKLAMTGWTERRLLDARIPYLSASLVASDHAEYYPGATTLSLKITFCPVRGTIFGAQCVGSNGVSRRIDVIATALRGKLTVADLCSIQCCYAPSEGAAKDPINLLGMVAVNKMDGLLLSSNKLTCNRPILDVRTQYLRGVDPLVGVEHGKKVVPCHFASVKELVQKSPEVEGAQYDVMCGWGRTAYFAHRTLSQRGVQSVVIDGGHVFHKNRVEVEAATRSKL